MTIPVVVTLSILLGIGIGLFISVVIDVCVRRNIEKEIEALGGDSWKVYVRKIAWFRREEDK